MTKVNARLPGCSGSYPSQKPFAGKRRLYNAVRVCFIGYKKEEYVDAGQLLIRIGDKLVINTRQGLQYVEAVSLVERKIEDVREIIRVVRRGNKNDPQKFEYLRRDTLSAMKIAAKMIRKLQMKCKLINIAFSFDQKTALIYFAANTRIDFRQFVRDIAHKLRCRIEMRQISLQSGVGTIGAHGVCGRTLCCTSFLKNFASVSIRQAKQQQLSPNFQKLSGPCGRLHCCLMFENNSYIELEKSIPQHGTNVLTPLGPGIIKSYSLLQRTVIVYFNTHDSERFQLDDIIIMKRPWTKKELSKKKLELTTLKQRSQSDLGEQKIKKDIFAKFVWGIEKNTQTKNSSPKKPARKRHSKKRVQK